MVRGTGVQADTTATDETNQIYPTCYAFGYENGTEIVAVQDAAARLAGSPQADVQHWTRYTATGRSLAKWTFSFNDNKRVEYETFNYDPLGRTTAMSRYQNADAGTNPVTTNWHYDTLGKIIELDDPAPNAPQFRSYDTWGELTSTGWCDPAFGTCPSTATAATANRRSIVRYDALGRATHREDRTNGNTIAETVNDYLYDTGVNNTTPAITATNVLGRLAKATSPTSSTSFSYDPFGRVNAEVFTDLTLTSKNVYVEKHDFHGDGSASTLHLLLPDTSGFVDEHADYSYDSAGRTSSAKYTAGSTTQSLFTESGGFDVFGRLRHGSYAAATFDATFADTGRRMINDVKITTPGNKSREVSFAPVAGTAGASTAFDPVGRERVRSEFVNGTANPVKVNAYDTLGRLTTASTFASGALTTNRGFTYDPLGNVLKQTDPGVTGTPGAVAISYMPDDRDRICAIGYAVTGAPKTCNVAYDVVGNITSEPTRSGAVQTFAYEPGGKVRTITKGATTATFDYDAFGAVQRLVLAGAGETSQTVRHDKHFGGLIEQRDENGAAQLTRSFPIPGGLATRHGASGPWTFKFGESRGLRYTTNASGEFVQDADYQPFGEAKPCIAPLLCPASGSAEYTSEEWNGGDLLSAFGLNQLGARLYDPVIGRFLSRDPIFDAGNGFNPYAFAANDPINNADPSGTEQTTDDPTGFCVRTGCGAGGGSGGGGADSTAFLNGFGDSHLDFRGKISFSESGLWFTVDGGSYKYPGGEDIFTEAYPISKLAEYLSAVLAQGSPFSNPKLLKYGGNSYYDFGAFVYEYTGGCPGLVCGSDTFLTKGQFIENATQWRAPLSDDAKIQLGMAIGMAFSSVDSVMNKIELSMALEAEEIGTIAAVSRGQSQHGGIFTPEVNKAGGTNWTSTGSIDQRDVAPLVNGGMYRGAGNVDVITGVHGFENGTTLIDGSLFTADKIRFGNLPGVNVHNFPDLSEQQLRTLLNGSGTTIGAFCDSGACLAPYK